MILALFAVELGERAYVSTTHVCLRQLLGDFLKILTGLLLLLLLGRYLKVQITTVYRLHFRPPLPHYRIILFEFLTGMNEELWLLLIIFLELIVSNLFSAATSM